MRCCVSLRTLLQNFMARRCRLSTSQPYAQLACARTPIDSIRNESEVTAIVACRRDTAQVLSVLVPTESLALRWRAALPKGDIEHVHFIHVARPDCVTFVDHRFGLVDDRAGFAQLFADRRDQHHGHCGTELDAAGFADGRRSEGSDGKPD